MPAPSRRHLLIAAAALLTVLGGAWFLRPARVVVEVAPVVRAALAVTIEDEGQTRIHPRYVVAAPVAGRLAEIRLDPGDPVSAGQTVAHLAPAPLDARSRERAEAQVAASRAALRSAAALAAEAAAGHSQAASTLARYRDLAAAGQLSDEELERAITAERSAAQWLDAAGHRVEAARFEVESARTALLDAESGAVVPVRSPSEGVVLRLHEESERVVAAGTPLLEIGDLADLEIVVEVLSTDAVAVGPGAPMSVDVGGGREFPAHVDRVEPAGFTKISPLGIEEQRVGVIGHFDAPAEGVGDRFRVRARIVLWQGEEVVQVPTGGVFRSGEGWGAYVVEEGRARRRDLRLGHRGSEAVEVLQGLAPGERVVLYPGREVADGVRVRETE